MKIIDKIVNLDRRIIFIVIGLSVILPLLFPIGLRIDVSAPVVGLYNAVENLKPGSTILISCDYDPGSKPELYPMTLAIFRHIFKPEKNLKVVVIELWAPGAPLAEKALDDIARKEYGRVYGTDYVNLGFKEGRENVMVSMGREIHNVFPSDFHGTPVSEIPIMANVHTFKDFAMIINISAGYPGTKEWVQQVTSRFNIKLGSGCTAVSAPEYYPYFQAKQLVGLLGGLKGAAEYEKLVNHPGIATSGMDAQTISHLMIILFIVLGNIIYIIERRKKKK